MKREGPTVRSWLLWYRDRFNRSGRKGKLALGCLPVFLLLACCGLFAPATRDSRPAQLASLPERTIAPGMTPPPRPTDVAVVPTDAPVVEPTPTLQPVEYPSVIGDPPLDDQLFPTDAPGVPTDELPQFPTLAPTATSSVPSGTVATSTNIRAQPSTDAAVAGAAKPDEVITLTGRLADSSWFAVETAGGVRGWIRADLLTYNAEIARTVQVEVAPVVVVVPTTAPAAAEQPARQGPSAPQGSSCPDNAPVKCNRGSNGWIYHVRGGRSYNNTKPEQCFATSADAEAAGYRAAQN